MVIIVRYGELALKSHSIRRFFTKQLVSNIQDALFSYGTEGMIEEERGRIYVQTSDRRAIDVIKNVFGVVSVSWAEETDANIDSIASLAVQLFGCKKGTFAVRARRTGNHPYTSQELAAYVGEKILEKCPDLKVNLKKPENEVHIEVRNSRAFVFLDKMKGVGGMPLGTQGDVRGHLRDERDLLALWMMMKRGCRVYLDSNDINEELLETAMKWGASTRSKRRYLAEVTGHYEECLRKQDIPVFCPLVGLTEDEIEERLRVIS